VLDLGTRHINLGMRKHAHDAWQCTVDVEFLCADEGYVLQPE
jgi:hypothetical protein